MTNQRTIQIQKSRFEIFKKDFLHSSTLPLLQGRYFVLTCTYFVYPLVNVLSFNVEKKRTLYIYVQNGIRFGNSCLKKYLDRARIKLEGLPETRVQDTFFVPWSCTVLNILNIVAKIFVSIILYLSQGIRDTSEYSRDRRERQRSAICERALRAQHLGGENACLPWLFQKNWSNKSD